MSYSRKLVLLITFVFVALPWSKVLSQEAPTQARFHHVHLNSLDPAKAIDFYTRTFDVTKKTAVAGMDAIQSENMWVLFNQVTKPPATAPDSAIWHFGWGSTDMEADYQKHLAERCCVSNTNHEARIRDSFRLYESTRRCPRRNKHISNPSVYSRASLQRRPVVCGRVVSKAPWRRQPSERTTDRPLRDAVCGAIRTAWGDSLSGDDRAIWRDQSDHLPASTAGSPGRHPRSRRGSHRGKLPGCCSRP